MERNRKIKILSLVALIVAVLGLGVAFAALSSKLTINGRKHKPVHGTSILQRL